MKLNLCRRFLALALILTLEARATDFVQARIDGLTNTGDVMAYVLPVAALSMTAYLKDREGAWQLTESVGITMGVAVALKYTVRSTRPNGDPYSFPSGHAAISFSSAEYIRKRYGWEYGVPAYALASFVGFSRVRAHEHYFKDVAAGAGIGILTTYLITTPYKGWHIQPEWSAHNRSVKFSREF
jgi:membrane-associated phospholipid phosphatase